MNRLTKVRNISITFFLFETFTRENHFWFGNEEFLHMEDETSLLISCTCGLKIAKNQSQVILGNKEPKVFLCAEFST